MNKTKLKELNLNEIHERITDLMLFFHNFCEEYNLRYYVAYGSLIGAIRHKGFIPWDDDFDIQMPREDFTKMLSIFKDKYEKDKRYKMCSRSNTLNYYYGIPRLCDQRFVFKSTNSNIEETEMGIFIDIYPLDNYGNTFKEADKLKRKARFLNTMYTIYINKKSASKSKPVKIARALIHKFLHVLYGSHFNKKIDNKIYNNIKKKTHSSDKYIGVICWDYKTVPYEKSWFEKRILADFEDKKFWIPAEYDKVLRKSYGDYMKLPPEDQRVATHYYKIYEKIEEAK